MKKAGQHLLSEVHISNGCRIAKFPYINNDRSGNDQGQRDCKHQFRMFMQPSKKASESDLHFPAFTECPQHVKPDKKSQTAQNDQQHGDEIHGQITLVRDQTVRSENIDSGVTECGHRGKHRKPETFQETGFWDKDQAVQKSTCAFNDQRSLDNLLHKSQDPLQSVQIIIVPYKHMKTQAEAFAEHHHHPCP